jgi:thiosulfate/3-mercaptopyruvate sulfurtransferase
MIAIAAVITLVGTSVPTEAATTKPTSITLKTTASTVDVKGKVTVSVKSVKPASASKSVTFKSSNTKIATVSSKGVVTGKKAGKVTITATSTANTKVKKTIKLTVKNIKPSSISLSATTASLYVSDTTTLKATAKPAGVYCPVTFSSDNEAVATVSSSGKVTAVSAGTAVITAESTQKNSKGNYLTKKCKVTVTNEFDIAEQKEVESCISGTAKDTVLVDARIADSYQGWALGEAKNGGHLKNAVNISAQWLDCWYWSNASENKTREESIQKELDANSMTTAKSYIIYDTNGTDAIAVARYLRDKGYTNIRTYNATTLINASTSSLESYTNYNMYVPAEVVKSISDNIVSKTALSDQAKSIVGSSKVVLLDVSWGTESESGYLDGHVPGAVHVNTDDYETPTVYVEEKDSDYRTEWRLNSDEKLFALATKNGITKDTCVIITGSEPMATTRMGIILKYLGCDNVHVMSEGMVGWKAQGYELETKKRSATGVKSFGVDTPANADLIDTIAEAKAILADSSKQLIDTRTEEEWNGTSSGYSYHDLMGRISGTIFSPSGVGYSSSMYYYRNPDKSMRSKEVIEAMWKEQGIDTGKHMSFFCGSGWRAAEEVWDAMVLGYTNVSLYSDGWIGWSNEGNTYINKNGNTVHYDKTTNKVVSGAASE